MAWGVCLSIVKVRSLVCSDGTDDHGHGCDALTTGFMMLLVLIATMMGSLVRLPR